MMKKHIFGMAVICLLLASLVSAATFNSDAEALADRSAKSGLDLKLRIDEVKASLDSDMEEVVWTYTLSRTTSTTAKVCNQDIEIVKGEAVEKCEDVTTVNTNVLHSEQFTSDVEASATNAEVRELLRGYARDWYKIWKVDQRVKRRASLVGSEIEMQVS